jgi:16S rRNA (guanine527-N7)-methyltransferase
MLATKGIVLPLLAADQFRRYYETLIYENKKVNLTRITDESEVYIKHFLDSLEVLAWHGTITTALLDVGSGAGLPGLPLKIACPQLSLTLIDSSRKRVHFLKNTAAQLELDTVTALHGRAEDFAQNLAYREQFPLVVSRAVARMNVLSELCLPFVSLGGFFVAYKGPEGQSELDEAIPAIAELGGATETVWPYTLPDQLGERTLLIIKKVSATPKKYPRKAGLPEKKPL